MDVSQVGVNKIDGRDMLHVYWDIKYGPIVHIYVMKSSVHESIQIIYIQMDRQSDRSMRYQVI